MLMNNLELEAVRRLLFFSVADASRMVSHSSEKAWRNWESGKTPVPGDVQQMMQDLLEWRDNAICSMIELIGEHKVEHVDLRWYRMIDDWLDAGHDEVHFKPQKSVLAYLIAQYPQCRLISV